jgi:PAS domain S-box-containing protein
VVDSNLRVLSVNPAFVRTFGIQAKDAEGAKLPELSTGLEQDDTFLKSLATATGRKNDIPSIEISIKKPGVGRRDLLIQGKVLNPRSNEDRRILIIVRNLTEQRNTERRMNKLMRELEEINSQLSHYTSVVSHDLQAPLHIAANYVRFLKEDTGASLPEKQRGYLDGIEASLDLAQEMIGGLLKIARIRHAEVDFKRVYRGPLVRKIANRASKGVEVDFSVDDKWPSIVTEPNLLQQILSNLVENAIKYNSSAVIKIEISWKELPENSIELVVRDNGPGIEEPQRKKIFQPFRRLHSKETVEGSGLGLSIAQASARRLGGSIRLESEKGEGSAFFTLLPRDASEIESH